MTEAEMATWLVIAAVVVVDRLMRMVTMTMVMRCFAAGLSLFDFLVCPLNKI